MSYRNASVGADVCCYNKKSKAVKAAARDAETVAVTVLPMANAKGRTHAIFCEPLKTNDKINGFEILS